MPANNETSDVGRVEIHDVGLAKLIKPTVLSDSAGETWDRNVRVYPEIGSCRFTCSDRNP